jgi:hypothetical protein
VTPPKAVYESFQQCVFACWENRDLMREYRRLTGHKLGLDVRTTLDKMIDNVTRHVPDTLDAHEAHQFLTFVRDCIWLPLAFAESES